MSDEHFLARWSRRKREAEKDESQTTSDARKPDAGTVSPDAKTSESAGEVAGAPAARPPPNESVGKVEFPDFDPTSLPPTDSIGAETDITAFLTKNVPSALKHAALRRAWTTDTAIRDFVGLQENDWDFTNPDSIPGFGGTIAESDVSEMVRRVFGELSDSSVAEEAVQIDATDAGQRGSHPRSLRLSEQAQSNQCEEPLPAPHPSEVGPPVDPTEGSVPRSEDAALQNKMDDSLAHSQRRRQHGRALPQDLPEEEEGGS